MQYNAIDELKRHTAIYGGVYRLPNGEQVRLKPHELKPYLVKHGYRIHQPSYQGDSIENEQVGIKHS